MGSSYFACLLVVLCGVCARPSFYGYLDSLGRLPGVHIVVNVILSHSWKAGIACIGCTITEGTGTSGEYLVHGLLVLQLCGDPVHEY